MTLDDLNLDDWLAPMPQPRTPADTRIGDECTCHERVDGRLCDVCDLEWYLMRDPHDDLVSDERDGDDPWTRALADEAMWQRVEFLDADS